ncbi:MAG: lipid-A-disaccharide synthase N-terminal domain-containing protein [Gammaproteobacteria bacterium]|nr:lipid-A-disaccharide synthase N-terminal domain-containing protein [Gammaproteobacteria bacterium]
MSSTEIAWLIVGFAGQGLFGMRFIVQWISSERSKRSMIPISFWYFSLLGGCILSSYALYKQDPVFILGQSTGLLIYSRNLYFVYRERRQTKLESARV